jgi:thioredoxin domain-containing protein 5
MLFLFLLGALAEVLEQCEVIDEGYVLSKYYTPWCPACQKLGPFLEEISNKADRHSTGLKIRAVNCDDCHCESIKSYPTLKLSKDGATLGILEGAHSYKEVVEFIAEHTHIEKSIFDGHEEKKVATVSTLTAKDFLGGFDGPHVVLFYAREDDKYREMLKELAKIYDGKISFGEINSRESVDLLSRFHVRAYPSVSGIFNGLVSSYTGKDTLPGLIEFCDTLIRPSFQSLSLASFNNEVSKLEHGEPIYVVFYRDVALATGYYQHPAHLYKFKARIFKTNDEHLFERASIFPKAVGSGEGNTTQDPAEAAILAVYKNGSFFRYEGKIGDETATADWIFHTHYRYLTRVDNSNFYSVFHGLKPVMLLLTFSDKFVQKMNDFSADRHLGAPYADMLYAAMDMNEYPLFVPTLLQGIKTPGLVVFEPWKNLFYYTEEELTDPGFEEAAMRVYTLYQNGRLPLYPPRRHRLWRYAVAGGCIAGLFGLYLYAKSAGAKKIK